MKPKSLSFEAAQVLGCVAAHVVTNPYPAPEDEDTVLNRACAMQWELAVQQYTSALKLATDPTDVATLLCLRSTAYARSTPQSRLPVHMTQCSSSHCVSWLSGYLQVICYYRTRK